MNLKNVLAIVGISATTTLLSVWGYAKLNKSNNAFESANQLPANYANLFQGNAPSSTVDFTPAASAASPAVVHIKTKTNAKQVQQNGQQRQRNPFFDFFGDDDMMGDFFGGPRVIPEQRASGSGVLITADGYIVTNNHVVNGADEINVTLTNKKTYKAKVIGTDASSDLAVIKIEASSLPYLVYGNSDEIKLGQWVLAIGYPLNLDVTITAGIISAKNRSININARQSDRPLETFLQTDAAVNQGNSGGALVNTSGELVGINSAIASPTGSYAGYSYAIPVNLVKKVVTDIVKFGTVQRAYLGISYPQEDLSEEQIKKIESDFKVKIGDVQGIVVTDVLEGGAAKAAGVKVGDIITKLNGTAVTSSPELQEQIAKYKPNDKISITLKRDNKDLTLYATLKAKLGNTDLASSSKAAEKLGGKLETVDKATAEKNDIDGGVLVKELGNGILGKSRVEKGFVITHVNDQPVKNTEEFYEKLKKLTGATVKLSGIYPGFFGNYAFMLNLNE
ncbi:MAG: trypsin-like peptidase domain-containing protein [Sediminibacterium sp.]|nr:trypsin-like peptidase domain-containing protein [Sediminibacterium sp.]MBP6145292.1 trypsin-like peptidase domain-containing protein [Sediminibacterium sp.]